MSTSYKIIELVKAHMSNEFLTASDTDAAKALGLSRTAVSSYKAGRDVMSTDTFARANELLKLPPAETIDITLTLQMEATKSDSTRAMLGSMRTLAKAFADHAKKSAAAILAAVFGLTMFHPSDAYARARVSDHADAIYIMRSRNRRRRERAKNWNRFHDCPVIGGGFDAHTYA